MFKKMFRKPRRPKITVIVVALYMLVKTDNPLYSILIEDCLKELS